MGKIQDVSRTNTGNTKKYTSGFQMKKETESSALYTRRGKGRARQESDHQIIVVTILIVAP